LKEELDTTTDVTGKKRKELIDFSPCFKNYIRIWNRLVVRDGVVYRKKTKDGKDTFQLVLPEKQHIDAVNF